MFIVCVCVPLKIRLIIFKLAKQKAESAKKSSGGGPEDLAAKFPTIPEEVILVPEDQLKAGKGPYNLTYCFSTAVKQTGWCGTCNPRAKQGENGYCDLETRAFPKNPTELAIPEFDKNWGFCSDSCSGSMYAKALYLSNMYVLDEPMCKESGLSLNTDKVNYGVNASIELCASFARKLKAEVVTWKLEKGRHLFQTSISFTWPTSRQLMPANFHQNVPTSLLWVMTQLWEEWIPAKETVEALCGQQ